MNRGILTWPNFRATILVAGQDRMHQANAEPLVVMFADRGGTRIGMLIESSSPATDLNPLLLRHLDVEIVQHTYRRCLSLSCSQPRFFREAYLLCSAVADAVVDGHTPVEAALVGELSAFQSLLEELKHLSLERQIGLFGELCILRQLIAAGGPSMVRAWTGPLHEPHDFRLGRLEFEVKCSGGMRRIHTVNGLAQTVPSSGFTLAFLSVLLAPADAAEGESLPTLAAAVLAMVGIGTIRDELERSLAAAGYQTADAPLYPRRWTLRAPVLVVPVDGHFPAVTAGMLADGMGEGYARLREISYSISLDGLGSEWKPQELPAPQT